MADPLRATFRKPFAEQVAAFRLRLGNQVPTARWDDIWQEGHDSSFMVAGAVKADLLADLAGAVDRAIAEGTGFDAFKADFRGIVEKHGWHGWTGEGTAKGEAWRMRVIYNTNMRTSYMAGRHAQLVEGGFRYWVYRHGGSREPRLQHLGWDGLILEPGHPFWATHYPPNGWGCSCRVFGARTLAAAKRRGGDPGHRLPDGWDRPEAKTGAPPGIDRGWAYAPGASVAGTVRAMTEKTVAWPYELGKAYMAGIPEPHRNAFVEGLRTLPSLREDMRRYAQRALGKRAGQPIAGAHVTGAHVEPYRTLGRLTSAQEDLFTAWGIDARGHDFTVSEFAVRHVFGKHGSASVETPRGQRAIVPADYGLLGKLLNAPDRIRDDAGRVVFEKQFGPERMFAIFEPRRKRRMMSLVTMWVVKKAP